MTRSPSKKPARRKPAATDGKPSNRTRPAEERPSFPPDPRKPNRGLLAFGIVLFVVWLVLLLLLALF